MAPVVVRFLRVAARFNLGVPAELRRRRNFDRVSGHLVYLGHLI